MAETVAANAATYDSKKEAEQPKELGGSFVQMWLDALSRADTEEDGWRKDAEEALEAYKGKNAKSRKFNIYHSNIETLCPALYNSTPEPDVRRRFNDPDPIAKEVSDLIERALRFSVDCYDFDSLMKSIVKDGEIVGRGVPRVRYEPTFADMRGPDGQPVIGPDGAPVQEVIYEAVKCDYVPWRYFRRGPARSWKDVPWVAFGDLLTKDEVKKLNPELAELIPYDHSETDKKKPGIEEASIFRRALVWQIWDKDGRRVISICPRYPDKALAVVDDPLGLTDFFPVPRPYQPVMAPDSLEPITPYSIYKDLTLELNELTVRINKLIKQVRPRGGYAGSDLDVKAIAEAGDGELVPLTDNQHLEGGLEKWITWFPLDPTVNALKALLAQREQVKQTIYEVTGIADVLRGASVASETATAQQIKTQWGSLRIQDRQQEIARVVRDLFRLKAEIIAGKFSFDILSQMTGIILPSQQEKQMAEQVLAQAQQAQAPQDPNNPQPQQQPTVDPAQLQQATETAKKPSREEVEELLRSDILRHYRIDVESDSTIRGDLSRNQQIMTGFLQGTAQFAQAMAPLVQQNPEAIGAVLEIYGAFARQHKLGKQAEDALTRAIDQSREKGKQGPKPNPAQEAEKAKQDHEMRKMQLDGEQNQAKHQMDMEKMAAQRELDASKMEIERERVQLEREKVAIERERADIRRMSEMTKAFSMPQTVPVPQANYAMQEMV